MRTRGLLIKGVMTLMMLVVIIPSAISQRFHGGIMAGGVLSQVQGDSYSGFHKPGVYAGGFVNVDLASLKTTTLQVQMEINFIQKGSRDNADYEKEKYDSYLLRLNYIEVPLLFRATFFDRVTGEIGPTMDVLVSSSEKNELGPVENVVPLRPVTMSGIIGASVFVIPKLEIKFRFTMSILSVRDGVGNGYYMRFGQLGQFDDLLALTVAYRFK